MTPSSLAEQLFLIAFDPERGKTTANPNLAQPYGLAGAAVAASSVTSSGHGH